VVEGRSAGGSFEAEEALEGEHDAAVDRLYDTLRALLLVPVADAGAVAVKLELAISHEVGTLEGGEECFAALLRDLRGLAG